MSAAEFLTAPQLVDRWLGAITIGTLSNWRHKKYGPAYVKLGTRVIYPLAAVQAWEAERMNAANDDQAGAAPVEAEGSSDEG